MIATRQLTASEAYQYVPSLAAVLLDCVAGGASVSFMSSLTAAEAEAFFTRTAVAVEKGERILLAAFIESTLVGTVQIITATPPNQPHRADVAKLLVHRSARGQGVAAQLMQEVARVSLAAGKTLLVLDTVTGGVAERLYSRLGWIKSGVIPNYALMPDGTPCSTTVFWKSLA